MWSYHPKAQVHFSKLIFVSAQTWRINNYIKEKSTPEICLKARKLPSTLLKNSMVPTEYPS